MLAQSHRNVNTSQWPGEDGVRWHRTAWKLRRNIEFWATFCRKEVNLSYEENGSQLNSLGADDWIW